MRTIDTDKFQICDRCDKGIEPSDEKLVVGLDYKGENYIEVYCAECTPIVLDSLHP